MLTVPTLIPAEFSSVALEAALTTSEPHQRTFGNRVGGTRIRLNKRADRIGIPGDRVLHVEDGVEIEIMPIA